MDASILRWKADGELENGWMRLQVPAPTKNESSKRQTCNLIARYNQNTYVLLQNKIWERLKFLPASWQKIPGLDEHTKHQGMINQIWKGRKSGESVTVETQGAIE